MKHLKKTLLVISIIFLGCSSDDSDEVNVSNGFLVNGTFYETIYASVSPVNSSAESTFLSSYIELFSNFDLDFLGRFALYPAISGNDKQLVPGTYPTNSQNTFASGGIPFTVSEDIIEFRDNRGIGFDVLVSSENTNNSGSVTINSITNELNENGIYITTAIDIDYRFRGTDGTVVVGNYNGPVEFTDTP